MNNEPQQAKNDAPTADSGVPEADAMSEALDAAQDKAVEGAGDEAESARSQSDAGAGHSAAVEAEGAAADAAEAAGDIAGAELTVDRLKEELAEAKDAVLRAHAEAQNARRRADQDVDKARKFALERFAGDLLPVADNLERALEAAAAAPEANAIAEGVDLTLRSFMDVLGKNGIETVNPEGEPFDPQLHQAMSMVPNPDMEPNTVMTVMQKGYVLNGRLLRPAMVIVSKSDEQG